MVGNEEGSDLVLYLLPNRYHRPYPQYVLESPYLGLSGPDYIDVTTVYRLVVSGHDS